MSDYVTLVEAKLYLRVDHAEDDDIIELMITAASDSVTDIASAWDGTGSVPARIKLAVLSRVAVAYDERPSTEAGAGELSLLTPFRVLEA